MKIDHERQYFRLVDIDYETEQWLESAGDITYRPHSGYPRPGHIEEAAFAAVFERAHLASPIKNLLLYEMSGPLRLKPTQELASWCSTVFCWLATNCGQTVATAWGSPSVFDSWCRDNVAAHGINGGKGTSDLLAERAGVTMTLDMWRMVDQMFYWLSLEGRWLLEIANERGDRARQIHHRRLRNRHAWRMGFPHKTNKMGRV